MSNVSIIVPIYNVEKYLSRCLDSLINQTLKDIEIICVNDGSTDSSAAILEEYSKKDSRIKVITQINSGVSAARNVGIKHSSGDYIGFIDSDDYVDLDFFEKLYNTATKYNADIACAGIIRIGSKKKKTLIDYNETRIAQEVKDKFLTAGLPSLCYIWNKIYNRESVMNSKIEFIRGIVYEDMFFTPDILEKVGKLVTVPDTFYYYNYFINDNSIVRTKTDKNRYDAIEATKYLKKKISKYNIKISEKANYICKREYFLFGIKILKVYVGEATKKYSLFGIIPFMEMRER